MLKKALVIGALVGLGFAVTPASAEPVFCAHASASVNEHSVVHDICVP